MEGRRQGYCFLVLFANDGIISSYKGGFPKLVKRLLDARKGRY